MKIQKTDLQRALEIVRPGLASKEIIEQTTNFAFLGDRVVTYNDAISLSHPIKGLELTGAVQAEPLYEFLKRAKGKEIDIEVSENELKLKVGRSKAGLTLTAEIVLPLDEVSEEKEWHDLPEEFSDNLMFVRGSASRDMSRPVLTCVHVTDQNLEASDGFQIMRLAQHGWPFGNYLIPAEIVPEINKIEPTQVAESDGWLHFRNLEGTEISCRVLTDSFPDTAKHFDVKGGKVQFPPTMSEILDRAMVFTKQDHELDESMEIKLGKDKLIVHGKNEYGWFKEHAKVKYEGSEGSFWITPSLLQNILKRSNTGILGKEKIKFEGPGWEYVAVLKQMEE